MHLSRTTLFILLSIAISTDIHGQSGKKIEIIGAPINNKDIFFVSDVHNHNSDMSFISAMSCYLHEQYGINNVAMEMGRSMAYLMNRYIQDGDSTYFFYKPNASMVMALERWRSMNGTLPADKKITLYGVDFERMGFAVALQSIFKKYEGSHSTALYQYINNLPDSVCRANTILITDYRELRIETYDKAKELFEQEKEVLRPLLKNDYEVVESIMENPVMEKHFGKRDMKIPVSIMEQLKDKRFICFLGGVHTSVYRHFSTVRKYMRKTHNSDLTLVNEICKNFPSRHFHRLSVAGDQPNYMTIGPSFIRNNDSVMALGFGKYHRDGYFSLIDHAEFKDIVKKDNKGIPTYYVFSDLLKE
jgi:hypothetical protein